MPTVETLLKLCKYYKCSSDYFLDLTDVKTPVNGLLINNLNSEEAELICKCRSLNSETDICGILFKTKEKNKKFKKTQKITKGKNLYFSSLSILNFRIKFNYYTY